MEYAASAAEFDFIAGNISLSNTFDVNILLNVSFVIIDEDSLFKIELKFNGY